MCIWIFYKQGIKYIFLNVLEDFSEVCYYFFLQKNMMPLKIIVEKDATKRTFINN